MKDWYTATNAKVDEEAKRRDECQKEIDDIFKTINSDQAEYDSERYVKPILCGGG